MLLFAAAPGAFRALAADARRAHPGDGQVILDEHLPSGERPVICQGITGTAAATVINMAIGVLIDQGFPQRHARGELTRLATRHNNDLTAAAKRVLASVGPSAG